ncbi:MULTISPECIES: aldo/keto reductase [Brevibacillus]|jgi:aryl-alcohol dehydrogenase-like predicted oxidoreductase|uniref:aldo/keto reductase n=1 Tax=Brevibacillus TaxID=55080 RepID=UPI000F086F19|nr:aldo/keto reductase [Brevibacillus borstelensis]MBE5396241.1 aldo/keto reductase [Brevibacillus borstelensis]MCC0565765.1 aldo/keto reductase [Brevibacillus borstelensis]MCM3560369.1 aldo/keto reductase [Brevibacillus borstelensis]MCM3624518.1 aldo/keto reductase [Brevibacillus borstelensis]MED1876524.1 aldo/keto reductase [Brevibacillus borstelensis]
MLTRSFGRDSHQVSLLGFGAQRIVDEHDCTEEQAIAIIRRAVELGVNYFDTAPSYSDGQSESRVGLGLRGLRDKVWIATKTGGRTRDLALRDLEGSLKRLGTDYVDEWRVHNVMQPHDLEAVFAKGGALEALIEAREQGMVRKLSISGHTDPRLLAEAIRRFPFDSALVALSALDHFIYSFAHEFVPLAVEKGVAVIGMKVMALGQLAPWTEQALRYTWSLPVSTAVLGVSKMNELEADVAAANRFVPMTDIERVSFFQQIMPLVRADVLRWKAGEWMSGEWYRQPKLAWEE